MNASVIETGTSNDTTYYSKGLWKGKEVWVSNVLNEPCIENHALEIMHHYGEDGKHYCPTGYLMCSLCSGIAYEPEPFECNKWGVK